VAARQLRALLVGEAAVAVVRGRGERRPRERRQQGDAEDPLEVHARQTGAR
jgi:hypothetical protein